MDVVPELLDALEDIGPAVAPLDQPKVGGAKLRGLGLNRFSLVQGQGLIRLGAGNARVLGQNDQAGHIGALVHPRERHLVQHKVPGKVDPHRRPRAVRAPVIHARVDGLEALDPRHLRLEGPVGLDKHAEKRLQVLGVGLDGGVAGRVWVADLGTDASQFGRVHRRPAAYRVGLKFIAGAHVKGRRGLSGGLGLAQGCVEGQHARVQPALARRGVKVGAHPAPENVIVVICRQAAPFVVPALGLRDPIEGEGEGVAVLDRLAILNKGGLDSVPQGRLWHSEETSLIQPSRGQFPQRREPPVVIPEEGCIIQVVSPQVGVGDLIVGETFRSAAPHGDCAGTGHVLVVAVADGGHYRKELGLWARHGPPERAVQRQAGGAGVYRARGALACPSLLQIQAVEVPVFVGAHPVPLEPVRDILPGGAPVGVVGV